MASSHSELGRNDSKTTPDVGIRRDTKTGAQGSADRGTDGERAVRRFRGSGASAAERDRMLKEVRNIEFPTGLRGYDRVAVDRYVEQVNRVIAELEISSSPESAVRHALEEVSEETRGLLQRAHQTADEITARSRTRADERLEQAEREAQQLHDVAQHDAEQLRGAAQHAAQELRDVAQRDAAQLRDATAREVADSRETTARASQNMRDAAHREADELSASARREAEQMLEVAENRVRELARNAEMIWRERRRLIDDVRAAGDQLVAIGEAEAKRFPHFAGDGVLVTESPPDPPPTTAAEPAIAAQNDK